MPTLSSSTISKLSKKQLIKLIESGKLELMTNTPVEELMTIELPELFKDLEGKPIHIRDASRKYNVSNQTISRWVHKGYIPLLFTDGYKRYIDEGYMAWRADTYKNNPGQGKWLFDSEGRPYIKKSE